MGKSGPANGRLALSLKLVRDFGTSLGLPFLFGNEKETSSGKATDLTNHLVILWSRYPGEITCGKIAGIGGWQ